MTPRFLIVNTVAAVLIFAAFWAGWLSAFATMRGHEAAMLAFLGGWFFIGLTAASRRNWSIVDHIANGLPMLALGFTGIGLIMAASGLTALTPDALAGVFRDLVFALAPNIVGVMLMVWLREIAFWCGRARL